jgi:palmitoyl-protein thioesterase
MRCSSVLAALTAASTTTTLAGVIHPGEPLPDLPLSWKLPIRAPEETVVVEAQGVKLTRVGGPKIPTRGVVDDDDDDDDDDQPLPVVIWHGLGDSADAAGLKEIAGLLDEVHPGTYTYLISVVNGKGGSADRQASFWGNVTEQLETVCQALATDPILSTAPAIDAVGFSQGGQFLRGYIERCTGGGGAAPPVRSLLTFGSQHNGIAEFQACASPTDWVCQGANAILKSSTVWSDFVQSRLVPAQYYRDTTDMENYLEHSNFLADVNNERPTKNKTYADNLARLHKFVMVVFGDDKTVVPKESGWFAEVNRTSESVTPLRERPIYTEDWIGLRRLDAKGALEFLTVPGEHMNLVDKDLKKLFHAYLGPLTSGKKNQKFDSVDQRRPHHLQQQQQQQGGWKIDL